MKRVLIVEDEQHLADGLRFNLEADGYTADTVSDGESAVSILIDQGRKFDAVVLDVMLPGKDGFSVVAELRAAGIFVPVLMLTARGHPEDVLKGFESGADDYLAKPFELSMLLARLNALLRRREWFDQDRSETAIRTASKSQHPDRDEVFSFDGRTIDFQSLELRTATQIVHLTLMEADLLRYLVRNKGKVVSR